MDFFHGGAPHHFGAALGVPDVHAEKKLHDAVKNPAGKSPPPRLHLVQHRPRQPARANHAIRLGHVPDQVQKRRRGRGPVGIHVADQIGARRQAQPLDQCPALANGRGKFQGADFGKFRRHPLHHVRGIVPATVEHHHQLELALVIPPEKLGVAAQHRFDPILLVVSRYQQQHTGMDLGHRRSVYPNRPAMSRGELEGICPNLNPNLNLNL